MMNEISRNKVKIVLVSGISAVAGAANIWLMMLINRSVRLTEVEPRSMAQFGAVLGLMVSVIFLSQILLALGVSKFAIADRAEKKFKLRRQVEDDLFRCYEAVIEGNKELKFNHARSIEFIDRDLRGHAEQYRKATLAAETLWNLSSSWSTAVIFIGIGAL